MWQRWAHGCWRSPEIHWTVSKGDISDQEALLWGVILPLRDSYLLFLCVIWHKYVSVSSSCYILALNRCSIFCDPSHSQSLRLLPVKLLLLRFNKGIQRNLNTMWIQEKKTASTWLLLQCDKQAHNTNIFTLYISRPSHCTGTFGTPFYWICFIFFIRGWCEINKL